MIWMEFINPPPPIYREEPDDTRDNPRYKEGNTINVSWTLVDKEEGPTMLSLWQQNDMSLPETEVGEIIMRMKRLRSMAVRKEANF
jgi:hypothetical protein